ncbi:kinase subunit of RNA polymerase II carboxy-terminal domain kinase I [Orbilia brochopaga]|uniref:cyclin-dependent kinase n=1 Tax=Orbilia brochopaga TaxID=3140254 RepID=A0AAV9UVE8_9PEZI
MPAGSNPQDYADEYDQASSVSSIDSRGNDRRSIERSPYGGRHEHRPESTENMPPSLDDAAPSPKDAGTPEQQPPPPASPPPPPPPVESRAERDAALMPPPNAPRGPRGDSSLDASPKPSPIDASKGKVRFSLSGTTPKGKLPTGPRNQEFSLMRRVLGTASNSVPVAPRKHGAPTSAFNEAPAPKATKTLPTPRVLISRKVPFDRVGLVGEGTYGQVFKAKNWVTGQLVALKRVRMTAEKDGFPITAAREIKILQSLAKGRDSDKIIHLLDNMVEQNGFYMIFEYMDHDLTGILHHPTYRLTEANIKDLAHQFFSGLAHIHRSGILHRDIKSSNILINRHGQLKIADFGLARQYDKLKKDQHYTNRIITLWYRPIEILLGETVYTTGPDVWSAGCVFMELFTRKAIFQGSNEISQLDIIWNLLGTPSLSTWPGWKDTAWYSMLRPEHYYKPIFNDRFKRTVPADALALALRIFTYDPKKRPTAEEVLADPYFTNEPKAERTVSIETIEGEWHELESKKNRKREREERQNAARQAKQQP